MRLIRSRRATSAAPIVMCLGLIAACGSTAQQSSLTPTGANGLTVNGGSAGSAGGSSLGAGGGVSLGTGATGTGGPGGGAAGSQLGGTGTAGGAATSAAVPAGHTPIEIGFIYTTGRQQAAAALGAAGVTSGDEQAQWNVLISYVNQHGGLGGHPIKPVFFGESDTSGESAASQEQAACSAFTQDHHVFAAMSSFETTDAFLSCMQQHGDPTLITLESISDGAEFQHLPMHLEPGDLNLDRQATALAAGLKNEGYFSSTATPTATKAKVGIFTYDSASYDHAAQLLAAAARKDGATVDPADIQEAPWVNQTTDTSGIATASSSAVLKMRQDGVDHVMFLDLNGLLAFLYMEQAANQHYTPRYGLTSQSSGTHLAGLLGSNANEQLANSVGIGWIPALDLSPTQYPDNAGTAPKQLCVKLMRQGGQSQGLSSPGAELVALGQCDDVFFLKFVMDRISGTVTAAGLLSAANGVGNAYTPALTFTSTVDATHHDGASSVRNVAYSTSCTCFNYTSPPYPIS